MSLWSASLRMSGFLIVSLRPSHLLHLEALLALDVTALLLGHGRRIGHIDVGHGVFWLRMKVVDRSEVSVVAKW